MSLSRYFLAMALVVAALGGQSTLFAQEGESNAAVASSDDGRNIAELPYGSTLLTAFVLPGSAQLASGKIEEGRLYVTGLLLMGTGAAIVAMDLFDPNSGVTTQTARKPSTYATQYIGWLMLTSGLAIDFYGAYAFHRDWADATGTAGGTLAGTRSGRESLADLAIAPFLPENFFSVQNAIPLAAGTVFWLSSGKSTAIADFFKAETVPFMGETWPPMQALAARAGTAAALALVDAIASETLFRGLTQERDGAGAAIGVDTMRYLPDILMPGRTAGQTAVSIGSGALWAAYATLCVDLDRGRLGRTVAARFWYETLMATLAYLADPASADLVRVTVTVGL